MSKAINTKTRIAAVALAVGAVGTTGAVAVTGSAQAAPVTHATLTDARAPMVTTHVSLTPMPQGTVTVSRNHLGRLAATVNAFGLTPGSSHTVELVYPDGRLAAVFGTLTANSLGQASATLTSGDRLPPLGTHVVILNGTAGDAVSAEPIARTSGVNGFGTHPLVPVEVGASGANFGTPRGQATVAYNPSAQTITVTVNASGLTPGAHAAHIHVGSCSAQGPVQYMLMDFTANARGQIDHETRTVTHVTTPLPATGWYLNLHQGNSNDILDAAGNPTINFRPLLCGNIVR